MKRRLFLLKRLLIFDKAKLRRLYRLEACAFPSSCIKTASEVDDLSLESRDFFPASKIDKPSAHPFEQVSDPTLGDVCSETGKDCLDERHVETPTLVDSQSTSIGRGGEGVTPSLTAPQMVMQDSTCAEIAQVRHRASSLWLDGDA